MKHRLDIASPACASRIWDLHTGPHPAASASRAIRARNMTLLLRASRVASRMTHDTTLARGAERGGASGSKPIIIINKQARASRQVHIARAPLMTAACATDEAPTRHTRTDVQRRESDDLSTGTGSENSMDKTLTMARSADSSSGAGARVLARRPSNRRRDTSFFSVCVVFRP